MANASLVITIKTEETQARLQSRFQKPANSVREAMQELSQFFKNLSSLNERGVVQVQTGSLAPVAASGTLTLVSAIATDAITIGATTLTASSTPANENQWEIDGASDALDAESLKAAINAHSVLSLIVTATRSDNIVTVTAKQKGNDGNLIPLTSADATITASGTGFLAGGTGGSDDAGSTYALGIS